MGWGKARIDQVAVESAKCDYGAFERVGLDGAEEARVLDMGCFDGFNTVLKFACYANVAAVVGVDLDEGALDEARRRTHDTRFSWETGDAESWAGQAESFDLVYFSHVFQHVRDKAAALANARHLLKPGGHIVIKTFDDSCKLSWPDPDHVMRRLFDLYEAEILPRTPHTRHTDRNNGQKCPALLFEAGFRDIDVHVHTTDTLGKTLEERMSLFERFTYFRKNVPDGLPEEVACEQARLLEAWRALFERDDYYHCSNTFMVTACKPRAGEGDARSMAIGMDVADSGGESDASAGAARADGATAADSNDANTAGAASAVTDANTVGSPFALSPMTEDDLGQVMAIEVNAFSNPWTPLAYAMELRHNPAARYAVARDGQGAIAGYVGWWEAKETQFATIMHIAVAASARRQGLGSTLLEHACAQAGEHGCTTMQLQVRSKNMPARGLYAHAGFAEAGIAPGYYSSPDDDAVQMVRTLR